MPNSDTIKLLKECSAGTEMAISSIKDVIEHAHDEKLHHILDDSLHKHETIQNEIHQKLSTYHDEDKSPNPVAKAMSWSKIHLSLLCNDSNKEIASLMRDGCNKGVKSLNQYLTQYPAASSGVKKLTNRLIALEREMHDALDTFV